MKEKHQEYKELFETLFEDEKISAKERELLLKKQKELGLTDSEVLNIENSINVIYEYSAFISYSHKDMHWGKWLHKKLETYRLPSTLLKEEKHLPKKLDKVFKDSDELGAGDNLKIEIENRLRKSRYLIIICSPNSAKSEYVNNEIIKFQELGRGNKIIPFIIKGTPNSNDSEQKCFPPSISVDILAASIDEIGKEKAFVKVVATILGLQYDQLWQRHKRSEKRKFIIRNSIVSLFSLIFLSVSVWYWDYTRLKTRYYADYVEYWGIPHGIGKLNQKEMKHRYVSYLFEYQRGVLQKVKIVGSSSLLRVEGHLEKSKRDPEVRFEYRGDGKLLLKKCYNLVGLETVRYSYTEDLRTINIVSADERTPQALNSGLTSTVKFNNQSNIIRLLNEYDDNGRLIKQMFAKDIFSNTPTADGNGICGMEYDYYLNGQIKSIKYLDETGQRTIKSVFGQNSWESKKVYVYNKKGWLINISHYDLDDQLTNNVLNYSIEEDIYDKWGNIVEIRYLDRRNQLTDNQTLYASEKIKYDSNGNINEHSFHDKNGNLTEGSLGYAKLTNEFEYSPKLATTTCYYDKDGYPKVNQNGFAIIKTIYSHSANSVNVTNEYYNQKKQPCLLNDLNYSSISSDYDKFGNLSMVVYYDTLGRICNTKLGYAVYFANYKDNLKDIETYLPADSTLQIVENLGYCKVKYKYDKWRNPIESSYFDRKMNPVNNKKGYHKECWAYDEKGNIKSIIFYDTLGQLADHLDYKAAIYEATYEYNDYAQPFIINNYYDKDRKLVTDNLLFKTTPLHWACTSGQSNKVIQLLSEGADKFSLDELGFTPAQAAAFNNKMECLAILYPKFNYKNQIKRITNNEEIDILNCQLILSGKENDIIQYFENAVQLESQIIPLIKKYPRLVKSYYRCVAMIANQLSDCQTAYSMMLKSLKISYKHSDEINNDKELRNICSWFALKAGRHKEALEILKPFEQEIIENNNVESIKLNYANALLLNGRTQDAQKIYIANSGKQFFMNANMNWNNVVKGDFEVLTWFGYGKKEMNDILNRMGMESLDVLTQKSDKPLEGSALIGIWKCIENNLIIEWEIAANGFTYYKFSDNQSNLLGKTVGVWRATKKGDKFKLEELTNQIPEFAHGYIEIIDNNNMVLTILENGNNLYHYKERKYTRQKN